MKVKLLSLEKKWDMEGKSAVQKAKLRYYYRNRKKILYQYRSTRGGRDVYSMWGENKSVIEY